MTQTCAYGAFGLSLQSPIEWGGGRSLVGVWFPPRGEGRGHGNVQADSTEHSSF